MGAEVWRILSRLVLTPIIISKVGLAGYGTWAVLFSITAQFGVVKASFGAAYVKLTAEYDSKGDYKTLTSIISSGMVLVLGFSVVALGVLWAFRLPLLRALNVPDESLQEAAAALMIVATVVLLQLSAGAVNRALEGLQRLDLVYMLNILGSVIDFGVTLVLLTKGYGILGLAIGFAAGQVTALVLARYFCHRIEPRLGITPFHPTREGFSKIARLGGKFQLLGIMGLILNEGSKLLVSVLLGVSLLGVYEIAHKLIRLGSTVGHAVVGPLMPAFANLHAQESYAERTRRFYMQVSRVLAGATGLCFAFLAIFANDVIILWTGGSYPLAAWTLRVFAPGMFLQTLTGVGTSSLRARGKIRLEFGTALLSAVFTFGSAYPMYRLFGYHGLVLAFVSGSLIGPPWFLTWYNKLAAIDGGAYLRKVVLRPLLALLPPALLCWTFSQNVTLPTTHLNPRMQALVELLVWGGLFALIAMVAAWFIVLEPGEREAMSARWRRLTPRRGR